MVANLDSEILRHECEQGSEQALVHLLEGCRAVKFNGGSTVSADILAAFTLQLQRLLKTMLGAALSASKPSSSSSGPTSSSRSRHRNEMNSSSSSSNSSKANDVALLKQMYGCALKLGGDNDFSVLYSMWHS